MTERDKIRRLISVLLPYGGLLFLACATVVTLASLSPEEQNQIQTRSYNLPDSVIFPAVLNAFVSADHAIQLSDRSSGLIQTESFTASINGLVNGPARVSALVKNGTVKLNYIFETEMQFDTSVTNRFYRNMFSDVDAGLKR